jgi:hypothetical protein
MTDELDEYGVWVKSAPQTLNEPEPPELSEKGEPLQDLSELAHKTSQAAISEDSGFPADLLKNFLTDIEDIDEIVVPTINEAGQKSEIETPDVPSISPSLFNETIETMAAIPMDSALVNTEKAAIMESQNVYADLLSRIADALGAIHDELTDIRQELKLNRTANAVMPKEREEIIRNSITHDDIVLLRDELTGIRQELSRSIAALTPEPPKPNELALLRDELTGIREELSRSIAALTPELPKSDELALLRDELTGIREELSRSAAASMTEPPKPNELALLRDELTGIREELSRSIAALAPELPKSDDLALIRDELNSIREELSQIITKPAPEAGDEDKKIILTRNELSNIFNTAPQLQDSEDSSEESSDCSPAEETLPDLSLISEIALDETLPDLDDEYLRIHLIEESTPNEIKKLYEEGVAPLTPAPEDTSYLEMAPFAAPDLSNAVIDAPLVSEEIQEHPLEELSPEYIKNLSFGLTDADRADEALNKPLIDGLLTDDDSVKGFSIELDTNRLNVAYYGEEEDDALLELEEYEDEENVMDQDIGDLLMASDWEAVVEETSTDTPRTNEPTPEPDNKDLNISETPVSSSKESYDNAASHLTRELKRILAYMDQVLESLPDDKIEEFTQSEHFTTYKQIFKTLEIP